MVGRYTWSLRENKPVCSQPRIYLLEGMKSGAGTVPLRCLLALASVLHTRRQHHDCWATRPPSALQATHTPSLSNTKPEGALWLELASCSSGTPSSCWLRSRGWERDSFPQI